MSRLLLAGTALRLLNRLEFTQPCLRDFICLRDFLLSRPDLSRCDFCLRDILLNRRDFSRVWLFLSRRESVGKNSQSACFRPV